MSGYTAASVIIVGTAVVALWTHLRFPQLVPGDLRRIFLHWIVSGASLHLIPLALTAANGSPPRVLAAMVFVAFPTLTYMFLAVIWLISSLQQAMRGAHR